MRGIGSHSFEKPLTPTTPTEREVQPMLPPETDGTTGKPIRIPLERVTQPKVKGEIDRAENSLVELVEAEERIRTLHKEFDDDPRFKGSPQWVSVSVSFMQLEGELEMIKRIEDITEQRRRLEQFHEREAHLDEIYEAYVRSKDDTYPN